MESVSSFELVCEKMNSEKFETMNDELGLLEQEFCSLRAIVTLK